MVSRVAVVAVEAAVVAAVAGLPYPSSALAQCTSGPLASSTPHVIHYVVRGPDGAILDDAELRRVRDDSPKERGTARGELGTLYTQPDGTLGLYPADGDPANDVRVASLQYVGSVTDCMLVLDDVTLIHRGESMRLQFDYFSSSIFSFSNFRRASTGVLSLRYPVVVDSLPFQKGTFALELDRWLGQSSTDVAGSTTDTTIPAQFWRRVSDEPGFDYSAAIADGQDLHLVLQSMASLPGPRLFLGGTYHNGAVPVHSALLVSRSGGASWIDVGVEIGGSGVRRLAAFGRTHIWALLTAQIEGTDDPVAIVRSSDAGATWQTLQVRLPAEVGLASVEALRFYDADRGLFEMHNANGQTFLFETRDGGQTWATLWDAPLGPDLESFVYPQADVPLHATLSIPGLTPTGLVRVVDGIAGFVVEQGPDWHAMGSIAREYTVVATALVEKDETSR